VRSYELSEGWYVTLGTYAHQSRTLPTGETAFALIWSDAVLFEALPPGTRFMQP
jgi:hypothetical protein